MRVCVYGNYAKSAWLVEQLHQAGAEMVGPGDCQVLLVDTDSPYGGAYQSGLLADARKFRIPVCLIPHGANPQIEYDGLRPADYPIRVDFVHGEGHKRLHEMYGYPRRVEVVGWTYGPMSPPLTPEGPYVESILFCPLHPWADGTSILPQHQEVNEQAYNAFLNLDAKQKTVRLFGADEPNGITHRADGVTYEESDLLSFPDYSRYDAVLAYGSAAYAALAAGVRTVMFGSDLPVMDDFGNVTAHFDDYREYIRYPYDLNSPLSLDALFAQPWPEEWVRLFVGEPFDARRMYEVLRQVHFYRDAA